ncbi:MAG TPA: alkaline phosphatase family protein [Rhizomicrobium sp.]|nr:alkaline phosphatase family protein [Rhizomicrobium sp.]
MKRLALAALLAASTALPAAAQNHPAAHNVVIFVADGLRYSSVTPDVAPTMSRIRREGVDFANSHAIYPTLTTANASAIATGHYLGDTGDYANVLYAGFPLAALQGSNVPFLEQDAVLQEMKQHYRDGYMGPTSLLCAAREAGFSAAVIGKTGPAGIQTLGCLGKTVALDDAYGHPIGQDGLPTGAFPLEPALANAMQLALGTDRVPFAPIPSELPYRAQQAWLSTATDEVILPALAARRKPFALVFWSRDPDATQHAQQDSLGTLNPGINGPTAKAAIANADANLTSLLNALKELGLDKTTDVFVTADHGFSTIAKSVPDAKGDLPPPAYPSGFLALEVSNWLGAKLFDPDAGYQELDPSAGEHPARGSGIIGRTADQPMAIVAANGGSDLIYTLGADARAHAKTIYDHLVAEPYVGGLFVNDALFKSGNAKDFAGALPMSELRMIGASNVPQPAIVVAFRSFEATGCKLGPELCAVEIADTSLQTGQGMHGNPSRADTRNFMAAIGPDFKAHYVDKAPVGNTDIAPTLAHMLGVDLSKDTRLPQENMFVPPPARLKGRVIEEALVGGKPVAASQTVLSSAPAPNGFKTVLDEQRVGDTIYIDAAGMPGRMVGVKEK